MKPPVSIVLIIIVISVYLATMSGCRCRGAVSQASHREDAGFIDVRARSFSILRDTLAEKQTIRIEFYQTSYASHRTDTGNTGGTVPIADSLAGTPPQGPAGGMPPVKSIEIVTERNTGSSQQTMTDSSKLSQNYTGETLQSEQSAEARQDNGTVAIVTVVLAVAALLYFLIKRMIS